MGSPRAALTVFIADDSEPILEMLTELLSAPGHVEIVGSGGTEASAIEAIARLQPDVVILDLQLKAGSGTNVIRAVRAIPGLAAVRLMVTTNHTSPQLRAGCMELGANDFYDKVKELGELAACIAELADRKSGKAAG